MDQWSIDYGSLRSERRLGVYPAVTASTASALIPGSSINERKDMSSFFI